MFEVTGGLRGALAPIPFAAVALGSFNVATDVFDFGFAAVFAFVAGFFAVVLAVVVFFTGFFVVFAMIIFSSG
jgi:hypothetical protein